MVKLSAESSVDLIVMSSYLQDATVKVEDVAWLPKRRRFVVMCNRFMWESGGVTRYRCRTGLHFENVLSAKTRGLSQRAKDQVLDLLTMHATEHEETLIVRLTFAGGTDIRLEVEALEVHMEDVGEPWETPNVPEHRE